MSHDEFGSCFGKLFPPNSGKVKILGKPALLLEKDWHHQATGSGNDNGNATNVNADENVNVTGASASASGGKYLPMLL